jgi:hypothetical protein
MSRTPPTPSQWTALETRLRQQLRAQPKATAADLDLTGPLDLIALAVKSGFTSCRLPGSDKVLTLRATNLLDVVPGWIITVQPGRFWVKSGHPYLAGEMLSARLDVAALGLVPLALKEWGLWDPTEMEWGDARKLPPWAKRILERGRRPHFQMEACAPGLDPDDFDSNPIHEAIQLWNRGEQSGALELLNLLCQVDLRCLDAHAHLGSFIIDNWPEGARRHYETGVRIGQLGLGAGFEGVLPWSYLENRPFLRCLYGLGISLWRLGRFDEAWAILHDLLWLNPMDHQGARFMLGPLAAKRSWDDFQEEED